MYTHKITRVMAAGALSLGTITAGAAKATNASASDSQLPTVPTSAFTTQDGKVSGGWDKRSKQVACCKSTKGWGGDKRVTTFSADKAPGAPTSATQGPEFDSPRQQPIYNDHVPTKHVRITTVLGDYVNQDFVVLNDDASVVFPKGLKMTLDRDGAHGADSHGHPWSVTSSHVTH